MNSAKQHAAAIMLCWVSQFIYCYVEYHYAEWCYAECRRAIGWEGEQLTLITNGFELLKLFVQWFLFELQAREFVTRKHLHPSLILSTDIGAYPREHIAQLHSKPRPQTLG